MPLIDGSKEIIKIPYIYYLIEFEEKQVIALFDKDSKINALSLKFVWKLGFNI